MIDILLATFNSERHLAAQLDSLLAQTERGWRLIVRDAGSTDSTMSILSGYGARDSRIRVVPGAPARACANFAGLLECSDAPYVMFCDHDDVWFPEKIARSLSRIKALENTSSPDMPALVFTDAVVTDERLEAIAPSFFRRSALDPARLSPAQLAFQNVAPGCTMILNAALRRKALPVPDDAVMHDHWMMLVASVFGRIDCLREPTVFYRQHGGNVLGSPCVDCGYFLGRIRRGPGPLRRRLYANIRQAAAFVARFGDEAPECLHAAASLGSCSFLERRRLILRHRLFKNGILRNLGTLAVV